jgi:hypothetical protein
MNKEEIDVDRYYDSLYSKYEEEATVSTSDYRDLEEKVKKLEGNIRDIINLILNNQPAEAYEYAKREGLV